MNNFREDFRGLIKEIHAYYSRERNLRDIGGLTFQRVKNTAKPLIEYAKNHKGLLQDILDNPDQYPFHLFGLQVQDNALISSPSLGDASFAISFFRDNNFPSKKKVQDFVLLNNPG